MTEHPDEDFVRQAMFVCSVLCGFSVQAVVRLVGSPPLEGKSFTPVLAMFATGALVLLYALAAGMIFFSARKASFDERSEMVVDMKYGLVIGLILFLLGLIFLTDLHSRRLSIAISVFSAVLLILFVRLMIIGF